MEGIHLKYDGILAIFMPHCLLIFLRRSKKLRFFYGSPLLVYIAGRDLLVSDTCETFSWAQGAAVIIHESFAEISVKFSI